MYSRFIGFGFDCFLRDMWRMDWIASLFTFWMSHFCNSDSLLTSDASRVLFAFGGKDHPLLADLSCGLLIPPNIFRQIVKCGRGNLTSLFYRAGLHCFKGGSPKWILKDRTSRSGSTSWRASVRVFWRLFLKGSSLFIGW